MFVALLRALAHRGFTLAPGFDDPVAEKLLPRPWLAKLSEPRLGFLLHPL